MRRGRRAADSLHSGGAGTRRGDAAERRTCGAGWAAGCATSAPPGAGRASPGPAALCAPASGGLRGCSGRTRISRGFSSSVAASAACAWPRLSTGAARAVLGRAAMSAWPALQSMAARVGGRLLTVGPLWAHETARQVAPSSQYGQLITAQTLFSMVPSIHIPSRASPQQAAAGACLGVVHVQQASCIGQRGDHARLAHGAHSLQGDACQARRPRPRRSRRVGGQQRTHQLHKVLHLQSGAGSAGAARQQHSCASQVQRRGRTLATEEGLRPGSGAHRALAGQVARPGGAAWGGHAWQGSGQPGSARKGQPAVSPAANLWGGSATGPPVTPPSAAETSAAMRLRPSADLQARQQAGQAAGCRRGGLPPDIAHSWMWMQPPCAVNGKASGGQPHAPALHTCQPGVPGCPRGCRQGWAAACSA